MLARGFPRLEFMKEIILCKYGEIVLKGANRSYFEDMLCRELRRRSAAYGNFDVHRAQSTIYIEPLDELADFEGMYAAAGRVFGIIALTRAAVCEKKLDSILATARDYLPGFMNGVRTFKVEGKRADKAFPLNSMELSAEVGAAVLSACPRLRAFPWPEAPSCCASS